MVCFGWTELIITICFTWHCTGGTVVGHVQYYLTLVWIFWSCWPLSLTACDVRRIRSKDDLTRVPGCCLPWAHHSEVPTQLCLMRTIIIIPWLSDRSSSLVSLVSQDYTLWSLWSLWWCCDDVHWFTDDHWSLSGLRGCRPALANTRVHSQQPRPSTCDPFHRCTVVKQGD